MKKRVVLTVVAVVGGLAACGDDEPAATSATETSADADDATDEPVSDETEESTESADEPVAEEPTEESTEESTGESTDESSEAQEPSEEEAASVDLTGVCPNPLVLQTDWFPSPEHGYAYGLIGEAGNLDAETGVFSGPLLDTGIDLEIRAGGPYLGYQPGTSTMYLDDGIHLAYVSTDEAVAAAADGRPTVAVVAPLEINPQILMWDPDVYSFESFDDIGESGATVLYFAGATYVDYMVQAGILTAEQVDPSYDGAPARFVAEEGAVVQQGFATSEPYFYENELGEWMKPVDYLLVHDAGYEVYSQPLVVREDAVDELRRCLDAVVPIFQQSVVDHWSDAAATSQLILDVVEELDSFWVLYPGQMDYSVSTALELGVVGNGPDDVVGNFDDDRMAEVVELLKSVLDDVPADLGAETLYTNEFIDPGIGF